MLAVPPTGKVRLKLLSRLPHILPVNRLVRSKQDPSSVGRMPGIYTGRREFLSEYQKTACWLVVIQQTTLVARCHRMVWRSQRQREAKRCSSCPACRRASGQSYWLKALIQKALPTWQRTTACSTLTSSQRLGRPPNPRLVCFQTALCLQLDPHVSHAQMDGTA